MLFDSHCHIHDKQFYPENQEEVYKRAIAASTHMIVVGTSEDDAIAAAEFASKREGVWAVVGVHPHDTKEGWERVRAILEGAFSPPSFPATASRLSSIEHPSVSDRVADVAEKEVSSGASKIVGIGEIGLDYHYDNSPREVQIRALEEQLQWAVDYNLPVSFHVREAYGDFWPIFDNFTGVRGVLHCFTDTQATLEQALVRGLYIGVNGISTFTKDAAQQAMFAAAPLEHMLLETDAPFLTPRPLRGTINEPVNVVEVARHQAEVKHLPLDTIISKTTTNTRNLFAL